MVHYAYFPVRLLVAWKSPLEISLWDFMYFQISLHMGDLKLIDIEYSINFKNHKIPSEDDIYEIADKLPKLSDAWQNLGRDLGLDEKVLGKILQISKTRPTWTTHILLKEWRSSSTTDRPSTLRVLYSALERQGITCSYLRKIPVENQSDHIVRKGFDILENMVSGQMESLNGLRTPSKDIQWKTIRSCHWRFHCWTSNGCPKQDLWTTGLSMDEFRITHGYLVEVIPGSSKEIDDLVKHENVNATQELLMEIREKKDEQEDLGITFGEGENVDQSIQESRKRPISKTQLQTEAAPT
ncbi:unnamed protein product [Darwinula stevensoni]|uniref:Death domain-containing protein n=1 Tax=Darwinula stevensoni TaxID=69355 RepID=A0A7R9ACC7_9CRUS|nr:unnamed protein product [Darwinula stevensoni]CAG0899992.1 unnamed protein product [Darwinula stevensoni]